VKLGDIAGYAFSNLRRHKMRTFLTCAGVAVGVATLTVMVSLGTGLEKLIADQFDADEFTNRITVAQEGSDRNPFIMQEEKPPTGPAITDEAIAAFDALPGVLAAYPTVQTMLTADAGDRATSGLTSVGLPVKALAKNYHEALLAGNYWTGDDVTSVCVVPSRLLTELGWAKPEAALGKKIGLSGVMQLQNYTQHRTEHPDPDNPGQTFVAITFTRPEDIDLTELDVIGVYDSEKFGMLGTQLHMPLEAGKRLSAKHPMPFGPQTKEGEYAAAVVKVKSHLDVITIRKLVEDLGYQTRTVFDFLDKLHLLFLVFQTLLAFFGSIGLVVAFFGIANTMVMAVLERTREIGVLKALGARNRDILQIFLNESAAIGFSGGLLGVGIGWVAGVALNAIALYFANKADLEIESLTLFYVPTELVLIALGISTVVAVLAGIYPAWRAARQDPVVALRRE
jgi:putative ABC transport system permease protein